MELTQKEAYLVFGRMIYDLDNFEGPDYRDSELIGIFDSYETASKYADKIYNEKNKSLHEGNENTNLTFDDAVYDVTIQTIQYLVNEKGEVFVQYGTEDKFQYSFYNGASDSGLGEVDLTKLTKLN